MLRGERATLRAIERSDIPAFVRWVNDPEVTQFLSQRGPFSLAQEEQWFERQLEKHDGFIFGITTEEGELIGNIGLDAIDRKDRHAVLGIIIGEKEYWGRGYGTDAVRTMLRFAFDEQNLHRVSLSVYAENQRALRCYEKCGFKVEGVEREARFQGGEYRDNTWMGILRQECGAIESFGKGEGT